MQRKSSIPVRAKQNQRRRPFRLAVEHLEDRLAPGDAVLSQLLGLSWAGSALMGEPAPAPVSASTAQGVWSSPLGFTDDVTEDGLFTAASTLFVVPDFASETAPATESVTAETQRAAVEEAFAPNPVGAARRYAGADSTPGTSGSAAALQGAAGVGTLGQGGGAVPDTVAPLSGFTTNYALASAVASSGGTRGNPGGGSGPGSTAGPGMAPDATPMGPLAITSSEYQFAATIDPDVLSVRATELWARVYRPVTLPAGQLPLLVWLHGNHGTCGTGMNPRVDSSSQYTTTGTCPAGFVVTPNHLGYGYLADRLASWGYIVVSINANRGITAGAGITGDGGLNLARGRLILRHLQSLSQWNTTAGTTPASLGLGTSGLLGKLNFSQVGIMGHSRGGEGARAALNQYVNWNRPGGWAGTTTNPNWPAVIGPLTVRGIFEIGAVDGQTGVQLNAHNVAWNQLLPMCDGDVSNLQGVRPLDRMIRNASETNPTPKSSYTVWGANHNYYNTEWQVSDSSGCTGPGNTPLFTPGGSIGSASQRVTGMASLLAFFRGRVVSAVAGAYDPAFMENFDTAHQLPPVVTSVTRVDRSYIETPDQNYSFIGEDFTQATAGVNKYGVPNFSAGITYTHGAVPNHDPVQRAALVSWTAPGGFLQVNWANPGTGFDLYGFYTLDVRLSRQSSTLNPVGDTNFYVFFVDANDQLKGGWPINLSTSLRGPVGGAAGGLHPILQTARIPLAAFDPADLTNIRGLMFFFGDTPSGAINLTDVRWMPYFFASGPGGGGPGGGAPGGLPIDEPVRDVLPPLGPVDTIHRGALTAVRTVTTTADGTPGAAVEIEVVSAHGFPARDELTVLRVGDRAFTHSRYGPSGDENTLIFTLTPEEYASLPSGAPAGVQYGLGNVSELWDLGQLNKS